MGERVLSKYQYGLESTRGTAVAATRVAGADIAEVPTDRAWEPVRLADGSRAQYTHKRNDTLYVASTLKFSQLYYQMLPVVHQCSLDGTITPTETTGGQSDYVWAIGPSLTAANAPKSITLEMGDDVQAFEIEHVMFDNLKMAGVVAEPGESAPVTGEFSYFGRQLSPTSFTAAQALHSGAELMNAKLSRLYMDTSWAGLGGTEQTSLLRGWEVEILSGLHAKNFGSANKYFDTYGEALIGAMLTLDLEGAAGADSIFDLYQAGTERAIRLAINGSQIGSGTNYQYRLDLWGYFSSVVPLSKDIKGNNIHRALFVAKKDPTSGNLIQAQITTNHNAV